MKTKVIFIFGLVFLMAMFSFQITPKVEAAGSPTVLSVTTNHADGYFKSGEVINFQIVFSEAVDVAGNNPVLALNSGGTATYSSGTGSDTLVFSYSVGVSDNSSDLSYTATSSLTTTGTIKSVSDGTDTTNDLPDPSVFLAVYDIIIDTTAPDVTKLGDNSSDYTIAGGASVDLLFNDSLASSSKTAIETALTNAADKDITYSWNATSSVVTINGNISLTTFANDVKVFNLIDLAGNSTNELLLIDSKKETNQVEPTSGSVTINSTTPQALLTNPNEAVNIIVSHPVSNPSVDATNFVNNGVGVMPNITISIPGVASVNVPTSTTFTAASSSWTGIIGAPTITTVTLDADKTLSSAFEVGSAQSKLTFDKAVRIFVLDEGGKRVGYVDNGSFVEITTTCGSDSQAWTDANLGSSGDCKMDSGSDLIVWTKHFTKFAVYTQNTPSTCSPDTVVNGTVAAYPSCVITCNSGYSLSGNSCVARSYSGGGVISGPVVSKNMTTLSSVLMPIKLSLISTQAGNLTQSLSNNYAIKLNILEDAVATKTDFSISESAIGSLKPGTNLETVLFNSNIFEITAINSNGLINNSLVKEATVNITYPGLPSDLSGIGLYYYDSVNKKWSLISDANFDASKNLVSFSTSNLGKFAILKSNDKSKVKEFTLGNQTTNTVSSVTLDNSYINKVLSDERQNVKTVDNSLVKRLAGKILLQVANLGRAWYVDPISSERYYLADGSSSYNALRKFGLGIKNVDIAKIPVGINNESNVDSDSDGISDKMEQALGTDINKADSDGDGFSDKTELLNSYSPLGVGKINQSKNLVDKLKGRIVLQTEGLGQAWYINPSDGKRYYLADGEAAYQIMRQLSLGINNDLINKIPVAK
jgi:hypothetical protein